MQIMPANSPDITVLQEINKILYQNLHSLILKLLYKWCNKVCYTMFRQLYREKKPLISFSLDYHLIRDQKPKKLIFFRLRTETETGKLVFLDDEPSRNFKKEFFRLFIVSQVVKRSTSHPKLFFFLNIRAAKK
ncbi:hypothetical protein BpHYR1_052598, partial [Brachionus plicatilis]